MNIDQIYFHEDGTRVIKLDTYPSDDKYYCREFVVPLEYAIRKIREWFEMELDEFLKSYVWDWTDDFPEIAEKEGYLISVEDRL